MKMMDTKTDENLIAYYNEMRPGKKTRTVSAAFQVCILSVFLCLNQQASGKDYILHDDQPAARTLTGWQADSYPLGNGHFGVNFFGGVEEELWQFTDPSLFGYNYDEGGSRHQLSLTSAIELWMDTGHQAISASDYSRQLNLGQGMGVTTYTYEGVTYTREQLTSFPDNCFAARLTSSHTGKISFGLSVRHSYVDQYRTVEAAVEGMDIVLDGAMIPLNTMYHARIAVEIEGGTMVTSAQDGEGYITVTDVIIRLLCSRLSRNKKKNR